MLFVLENVNGVHSGQVKIPDPTTFTDVRNFYMSEKAIDRKPIEKAAAPDTLRRGQKSVPKVQKPATPVCPPTTSPANAPEKEEK
jgi:hypothetical protein